jgi:hypothetical protein
MFSRFCCLAALALTTAAQSLAAVKQLREYRLHEPKDRRILFEMGVTPEQDVLVFVAKPDGNWRLSRIRKWLDPEPEERTIGIPGLVLGDRKQWFGSMEARLLIAKDGRFAICEAAGPRIQPNARKLDFVKVVSIIDLRTFVVIRTLRDSDLPGLASGIRSLALDQDDDLVVHASESLPRKAGEKLMEGGRDVLLANFGVPDLSQRWQCQYSEGLYSGRVVWRKGEENCGSLLKVPNSGFSTVAEYLSGLRYGNETERQGYRADAQWAYTLGMHDVNCGSTYLSSDGQLQKVSCASLRRAFWAGMVATKVVERISEVKTGRQVGLIEETTRDTVKSRLAVLDGVSYLLVVEGGTRLRVYRISV